MASTTEQIDGLIDSNLPDNNTRSNKALTVRTLLKLITSWVRDQVNATTTTWLRPGTNMAGTNSEAVYRTGQIETRGGIIALTRQNSTAAMAMLEIGPSSAMQVTGGAAGNAAFIEFHVPGLLIQQFGVDTDGRLKLHPWGTSTAYDFILDGYNDKISTGNAIQKRKLVLYSTASNDHQFYGLGVLGGQFVYQVPTSTDAHIFMAGLNAATSKEVMRILGNGRVGIGTDVPSTALDVAASNPTNGIIAMFINSANPGATGAFVAIHQSGVAIWLMGQPGGVDAWVLKGYGGGAFPEFVRVDLNGNMGIGVNNPTSRLHVKGALGHNQFRAETPYTPTGTADVNGATGQVAWDANYLYVKTAAGWKRSALTTF
ncbi:hypothetical protein [uncultured Fibrella sp.]|uniref:hypothetical protein n=1 Tax=uncultured Fibrella sp. TaxID=1284596 RepID=UPI0035C9D71B